MIRPWENLFHLGLVVPATFAQVRDRQAGVLEVMRRAAADEFFQGLELLGAEDPGMQKQLAEIVKKSGKALVFSGGVYCGQNKLNIHDPDQANRRRSLRCIEKIIDEADLYGCKILYLVGYEGPPNGERAKGLRLFAESMAALADYARKKNPSSPVMISIENFYIMRELPFLVGPTREVAGIIRELRRDHPNIGLTFDTSHILQLKEDLPSTYAAVQDVIAHIHLSNCLIKDKSSPFYGDKHPPYGMAGSEIGIPELAAFLKTLKEAGHFSRSWPTGKPLLSIEIITPAGLDAEQVMQEAKEAFLQAWEESKI